MVEFFASLYDAASVKALMKRLKGLQDDLGHLNDVRTAQQGVKELQCLDDQSRSDVSQAAGMVIGWYLRELTDSEARLREDVRRFRKAKPFWRAGQQAAAIHQREPVI
jgi:CHAD domain-containing protein